MAGRERPGLAVPIALALAPTHRAAASHAGVASSATRRNTHTHTASDECWSACVVFPLSILLRCRVLCVWCAGFVVCFHSCSPNENRRRRGARGRGSRRRILFGWLQLERRPTPCWRGCQPAAAGGLPPAHAFGRASPREQRCGGCVRSVHACFPDTSSASRAWLAWGEPSCFSAGSRTRGGDG